jgi:hypothetical protein
LDQDIVVFGAFPFDFPDERGRRVQGVSLRYSTGQPTTQEGGAGWEIQKASLPPGSMAAMPVLPGVYIAHYDIRTFAGKPELKLTKVTFKSEFLYESPLAVAAA